MYIQAVFPMDYLAPKTQRDFSTLHLVEHLMIESLRKDKDFYDRDSSVQEMDTYGHILSATINRGAIRFNLEYLPSFETEALNLLDKVINNSSYRLDFVEGLKEDLIEELKRDSAFITLNDIFCKQNFDSFHKLRSGGSIRTIANIIKKDVEYWLGRMQQAPYYLITGEGKIEKYRFKNQPREKVIFNKNLPYFQLVEKNNIARNALFYVTANLVEQSFTFALEKYLRDEFQKDDLYIHTSQFTLKGLSRVSVSFNKDVVENNRIVEEFKYFLDAKPQEYLDFGKKKYNDLVKVSSVAKAEDIWDKILYSS
jgi:hypothetical protein